MQRSILNKSWKQHPTKQQLYGYLPLFSKTIQVRRTRHCWRSKDELISDVLLWTSTHRRASDGRPAKNYLYKLCADIGWRLENLQEAMRERERERIRKIRASRATYIIMKYIALAKAAARSAFWMAQLRLLFFKEKIFLPKKKESAFPYFWGRCLCLLSSVLKMVEVSSA